MAGMAWARRASIPSRFAAKKLGTFLPSIDTIARLSTWKLEA
jgi:hypothetical protein